MCHCADFDPEPQWAEKDTRASSWESISKVLSSFVKPNPVQADEQICVCPALFIF